MQQLKRTWAEISLDALDNNFMCIRNNIPKETRILGVVKADAYGHGAIPVSRELERLGAAFLAVSNLEEAVQLREAGQNLPILILGYTPPEYAPYMAEQGIRQEIHSLSYAEALSAAVAPTGKTLNIHVKLDTGMTRLGFFAVDGEHTVAEICKAAALPGLHVEGTFAHFAAADGISEEETAYTKTQYARFLSVTEAMCTAGVNPGIRHHCNSAGAMVWQDDAMEMVRPGIVLYGQNPSGELAGVMDLQPVMTLKTAVAEIRTVRAGTTIGYGRTYRAPSDRRIAVLTIGYADGLPRRLSNAVSFTLRGRKVPIVGRICMDMCMADITDVPDAAIGDPVTVFGSEPCDNTLEELAAQLGTITYELLCDISKRVPRIYLRDGVCEEICSYMPDLTGK